MKQQHRLAIIGKGRGHRIASEIHCEKWCISTALPLIEYDVDKVVECHKSDIWESLELNKVDKPFILLNEDKENFFKNKEYIDKKGLAEEYGTIFTSSVAWVLMHAYKQGFTEICLIGIDMAHKSEYGYQRDGVFYIIGYLQAKGVKIIIPIGSGLKTLTYLYGV